MSRRRGSAPPEGGWVAEVSTDSLHACVHCGRRVVHRNDGSWWHHDGDAKWLHDGQPSWLRCRQEDLDAKVRRHWWQRSGRPSSAGTS